MADIAAVVEGMPTAQTADIAVAIDPFIVVQEYEFLDTKTAFVPEVTYVNRVFDTVAADFVRWNTFDAPDPGGQQYPGPGTFGVQTSDYCVESFR